MDRPNLSHRVGLARLYPVKSPRKGELLAIRVMLVGTGKKNPDATVSFQLTDNSAATYEAAYANHGLCNTVSVNLPASKSQVASDGALPKSN